MSVRFKLDWIVILAFIFVCFDIISGPESDVDLQAKAILNRIDRAVFCGCSSSSSSSSSDTNADRRGCVCDPNFQGAQGFGIGGQTISAPNIHYEALKSVIQYIPKEDARILDIGVGSGIMAAAFYEAAGPNCTIIGIDNNDKIVDFAKNNLRKIQKYREAIEDHSIILKVWDGYDALNDSFDVIHVGAQVGPELLSTLSLELRSGGVAILPIETKDGVYFDLYQKSSSDGSMHKVKRGLQVVFVPLTHGLKN